MQAKLAQHTIRSINKIGLLAYSDLNVRHGSLDIGGPAKVVAGQNKCQRRTELIRADLT